MPGKSKEDAEGWVHSQGPGAPTVMPPGPMRVTGQRDW